MNEIGMVHKFEIAGLGKAPFKYIGMKENWFVAAPGVPAKPGGSCDFCGQGIAIECWVEDANGKQFKVGSDCISKVGDKGLKKLVDQEVAKRKANQRNGLSQKKLEELHTWIKLENVKQELSMESHPDAYFASKGKTMLDYVTYVIEKGGNSGRAKVHSHIMKILKER